MSNIKQAIQPGLCPINPETGLAQCPPPDRIECITVEKVYDSYYQVDNRNQNIVTTTAFSAGLVVGDLVNCALDTATGITCVESGPRVPVGNGYYRVTLVITVPLILTNPTDDALTFASSFVFAKQVILCAPEGVNVKCDGSTVVGCNCVVTVLTGGVAAISCDIQACLVMKSTLDVQLLVPSYGFCIPQQYVPAAGVCPPVPPAQCFGEPVQAESCSSSGTTV
ncbi:hypothetical protein [Metaclostridioides mangenotii]|uniref:hypothetical protein n=1 Tax=Metaclostridioides mangenotii TaxID=1540 RepID=UPI0006910230|nr:hypothetical protein [Clostridioides mangenotii]